MSPLTHLYKRKGNEKLCDNHRGISLLAIAGKILARVLLNRLLQHLEDGHLPENQCGCRKGRGTADVVLLSNNSRKSEEHGLPPVSFGIPEVFSAPSEFPIQSTNPPQKSFFRPLKKMRFILTLTLKNKTKSIDQIQATRSANCSTFLVMVSLNRYKMFFFRPSVR